MDEEKRNSSMLFENCLFSVALSVSRTFVVIVSSPASRRMVNLTYAMWILAQNVCVLSVCRCAMYSVSRGCSKSPLSRFILKHVIRVFDSIYQSRESFYEHDRSL